MVAPQGEPAKGVDIALDLEQLLAALPSASATSDEIGAGCGGDTSTTKVMVYDVWAHKSLGSFVGTFTAKNVPHHGTAFLRITP